MSFRLCLLLALFGLLVPLLPVTPAHAIPAFSRLYKTECSTCHTVFPERNEFGDAFEKNSYVWPGKLPLQAQEDAAPATPARKRGAEALFNSGLPPILPVSVMAQHDMVYKSSNTPKFDLDAGTELEMFAAGNFRKQVGFWGEYRLSSSSIGDVFAQFRHPFDLPVNVKIGKFKPKLSLWKGNDRSSLSGYGNNRMRVGDNPFRISGRQGAVELNSVIGSRVFAAAGVTDGPTKDQDSKDVYGHLSVRIGGTDFLGREPEVDLDHDSIWDFLTLTIGSFGYVGSSAAGSNDFYRTGLEGEVIYKRLKVRLHGMLGKDDDPNGTGASVKSRFYLGQAEYLLGSSLMPSFRFELQDIDGEGITRRYIPCVTWAFLQNLRLGAEYVYEVAPDGDDREATLNLAFAF